MDLEVRCAFYKHTGQIAVLGWALRRWHPTCDKQVLFCSWPHLGSWEVFCLSPSRWPDRLAVWPACPTYLVLLGPRRTFWALVTEFYAVPLVTGTCFTFTFNQSRREQEGASG